MWRSRLERIAGIVADCAPIAHSLLPHCYHTHKHTCTKHTPSPSENTLLWLPRHMLPFIRHFEYMVPQCHRGNVHRCTVFHLSISLTLPFICTCLSFTAASLLCPPLVLKHRVFRLFCVETESSKACLLQRNRYQYHSVAQ